MSSQHNSGTRCQRIDLLSSRCNLKDEGDVKMKKEKEKEKGPDSAIKMFGLWLQPLGNRADLCDAPHPAILMFCLRSQTKLFTF